MSFASHSLSTVTR